MRYICRIDDPLCIKASGHVGPGGLGTFDASIYVEVEDNLPVGAYHEPEAETLDTELESIMFEAMLADHANVTAEHIAGIINQKVIITETINVIRNIEKLPVPDAVKSDLVAKAKTACRNLIDTAAAPNTTVAANAKTAMKGKLS